MKTLPCYMMGTKAMHKVGDISRDEPDYCYITKQTDEGYIGHWVEGMGFVNVVFPINTTRDVTPEEQEFLDTHTAVII